MQPPEGRVYTARSLRSGGASAAEMVPLPRSKIEFLGGWAVDSKRLSQHYISRATPPTYAGRFFFDWLILPLADNMALGGDTVKDQPGTRGDASWWINPRRKNCFAFCNLDLEVD